MIKSFLSLFKKEPLLVCKGPSFMKALIFVRLDDKAIKKLSDLLIFMIIKSSNLVVL